MWNIFKDISPIIGKCEHMGYECGCINHNRTIKNTGLLFYFTNTVVARQSRHCPYSLIIRWSWIENKKTRWSCLSGTTWIVYWHHNFDLQLLGCELKCTVLLEIETTVNLLKITKDFGFVIQLTFCQWILPFIRCTLSYLISADS